ncbi:SCO1664 family protein [Actinomycetospora cinnamomea]|uniref:Putative repeat protein (TIGR03843 family) n=1 Tax=Actinomycetospora cinnamomea TaxID=663609 RepID=A0A2U1EUR2_9PSEU|nr:SCO1664 family protein [Actinomycetospora cinnamomea]PVZ03673.1 putative repeat protein (TIGR03843 family) [Actinomycetospora cinnamomea]
MTETPDTLELLVHGTLEVHGRLTEASNTTLLCGIAVNGVSELCVYKPVRGERPLWDFPDGTLAGREVATYLVSQAAGFDVVPPTVLRDGPFGPGMVQRWIEVDEERELVDIVSPKKVGKGWRTVLRARGADGDPALLVHADDPALYRMATLDVVVNNADRKGGHVLAGADGGVYGVDHGICLHREEKLRTVLWGWVGEPLPEEIVECLRRLRAALSPGHPSGLNDTLHEHLTRAEVSALRSRTARLLDAGELPAPGGRWPPIPWPAF